MQGRVGEINQMNINTRSVDARTASRQRGRSRTAEYMQRRRRTNIVFVLVGVLIVAALAFFIGSFAYKMSLSSALAINDDEVSAALVEPQEGASSYVLISGLADYEQSDETSSFLMLARFDSANNQVSFLGIPNNISVSLDDGSSYMLRDVSRVAGEGTLISEVSDLVGIEINHYARITDEGFVKLVDALGGLPVNIEYRVDDPRVSSLVLDVGEQTLTGDEALTYVSAFNYTDGRTTRAAIQESVVVNLSDMVTSKTGLDFLLTADTVASVVKTDMNFETLNAYAETFAAAGDPYYSYMPGGQSVIGSKTYFSVNSAKWEQVKNQFMAGENLDVSVDTSNVDKSALTIIVLNGSGSDGFAKQVADILVSAGYTIDETGNAPSYVYEETLVIYRDQEDAAAAQAIVDDLGVGRAVYASVYYSLTTDIQVIVGKDWKPLG